MRYFGGLPMLMTQPDSKREARQGGVFEADTRHSCDNLSEQPTGPTILGRSVRRTAPVLLFGCPSWPARTRPGRLRRPGSVMIEKVNTQSPERPD
jgi:hypothetical protein